MLLFTVEREMLDASAFLELMKPKLLDTKWRFG
jgi:hypothetical protein